MSNTRVSPAPNEGKDAAPAAATAGNYRKNLLQQLPAGSVLAFQALACTFTNQGNCYVSNWWLTVGLVTFLSATCIFFSFTDSVKRTALAGSTVAWLCPGASISST